MAVMSMATTANAETVGQTGVTRNAFCGGGSNYDVVDASSAVSADGVLTSFRYRASSPDDYRFGPDSGYGSDGVDLQVLRPAGGDDYTVIARVSTADPHDGSLKAEIASVPVLAGDRLGIFVPGSTNFPCIADTNEKSVSYSNPAHPEVGDTVTAPNRVNYFTLNLEATIESSTSVPAVPSQPDVESYSASKSVAPVSTSSGPLTSGQSYSVTVKGTYSPYDASLMMAGTSKYFAMCGDPLASPLFPSPATTNSRVGSDPEFLFAFPQSGKKCSAKNQASMPKRQSSVRFDSGAGYVTPVATNVSSFRLPNGSHSYTYTVLGAGQPLKIKIPGSNYRDNYGRYQVTIATARPVILPPA